VEPIPKTPTFLDPDDLRGRTGDFGNGPAVSGIFSGRVLPSWHVEYIFFCSCSILFRERAITTIDQLDQLSSRPFDRKVMTFLTLVCRECFEWSIKADSNPLVFVSCLEIFASLNFWVSRECSNIWKQFVRIKYSNICHSTCSEHSLIASNRSKKCFKMNFRLFGREWRRRNI